MSVRIEWATANDVGVSVLGPGDKAPDGQQIETGPLGLLLGPLCIEGTRDELLHLIAVCTCRLQQKGERDEYHR